jgi:hypothetical protein
MIRYVWPGHASVQACRWESAMVGMGVRWFRVEGSGRRGELLACAQRDEVRVAGQQSGDASAEIDYSSRSEIDRLQQLLLRAPASAEAAGELWEGGWMLAAGE